MGLKKKLRPIRQNKGLKTFLFFYLFFLLTGLILILFIKHGDVVLLINKYSREEWDGIVTLLTHIGLGGFIAAVMVLMSFLRIRYALMGLFNLGLVGIMTNLLKNIFSDRIRPFNYFYYDDFHRFIYSADLNYFSSFPSGHTMTIFAAMSLLAYFSARKTVGALLFLIAFIVGMTRVYLCQHFFIDVYFGSVTGVIITLFTIWLGDILLVLNQRKSFQKPVFRLKRKLREESHKLQAKTFR